MPSIDDDLPLLPSPIPLIAGEKITQPWDRWLEQARDKINKGKGPGIFLSGRVANYASLPGGLGPSDSGKAYLVDSDHLIYVWNGTAFPASGAGLDLRGPQGVSGPAGTPGATGSQGPQGVPGTQGPLGQRGKRGHGSEGARRSVPGSGSGNGSVAPIGVNQTGHGFVPGQPISRSVTGLWVKADKSNGSLACDALVTAVPNANNFQAVATSGSIVGLTTGQWDAITGTTGGLVDGEYYFLGIAGTLLRVEPTDYIQVVLKAISSTQAIIDIGDMITQGTGGSGGIPTDGSTGHFYRGDGVFTNVLFNAVVLSNGTLVTNAQMTQGWRSSSLYTFWAKNGDGTSYTPPPPEVQISPAVLAVSCNTQTGAIYVNPDGASNLESGYFQSYLRVEKGLRYRLGLQEVHVISASGLSSVTVDLVNGSYQRVNNFDTDCHIFITDTSPIPTSLVYAAELTLEVVVPGTHFLGFTAGAPIIWINGIPAPVLAGSGVNIIKFIRRQDLDGFLGEFIGLSNAVGTVTSVSETLNGAGADALYTVTGSPITGAGTFNLTLNTVPANFGFFGPTSGGAATPTWRQQVNADLPLASAGSRLLGSSATGGGAHYDEIILGTNLSMSGNTLNAAGGGGGGGGGNQIFKTQVNGADQVTNPAIINFQGQSILRTPGTDTYIFPTVDWSINGILVTPRTVGRVDFSGFPTGPGQTGVSGGILKVVAPSGGGGGGLPTLIANRLLWNDGLTAQWANSIAGTLTFTGTPTVSSYPDYGVLFEPASVAALAPGTFGFASFGYIAQASRSNLPASALLNIDVNNTFGPDLAPVTISHTVAPSATINGNPTGLQVQQIVNTSQNSGFAIGITSEQFHTKMIGNMSSDAVFLYSQSPNSDVAGNTFSGGQVRVGEVNYANYFAEFGLQENNGFHQVVAGIMYFPAYNGVTPSTKYNATFATVVGPSGSACRDGKYAQNWIGHLVDKNSIAPGGYGISLWGGVTTTPLFNGLNNVGNAPYTLIKLSGTATTGIDFTGNNGGSTPFTAVAEGITGHLNTPAITLAQGQAICFSAPTAAHTGVYMVWDGTNLKVTKNGGDTWTNLV